MSVVIGIVQSVFKVYSNILQSREKPGLFFRLNLLHFILLAGFTFPGIVFLPATLMGPIGGRMVAGIIIGGWSLYQVFREFGIHFNFPLLRSTFGYNVYAFIYQVQQWGINYLDRFLLLFLMPSSGDLYAVGIYDLATKCLLALEFVLNGLHNSFYPKVVSTITAQTSKGSTPELNRYYYGMAAVIMLLVSASIFTLPFIINFLDTKNAYQEAVQYLPYVAIIYVLKSQRHYFAVPFGILKYTKPLPIVSSLAFVAKIGLMFLLVRRFGIYGVIFASLASAALELFALRYTLKDRFLFQFNFNKLILVPCALVVLVLALEPLFGAQYDWQLHLGYIIITVAFLLWVYRNELKLLNFSKFLGR